jgi:hypothetical protein
MVIMALVAHYNLELHQIDVKTILLNEELLENICIAQSKGFITREKIRYATYGSPFID